MCRRRRDCPLVTIPREGQLQYYSTVQQCIIAVRVFSINIPGSQVKKGIALIPRAGRTGKTRPMCGAVGIRPCCTPSAIRVRNAYAGWIFVYCIFLQIPTWGNPWRTPRIKNAVGLDAAEP